ncbi:C45 family autoproteolytic acyltransferase/hydolase [Streptomyces venezuelae]|uniref:C45 family autoproteolytic acyltransferase/hydolase n=1 Tax=Streptomyces venezuelae TaxID=54571 RepID=UPI0036251937
MKLHSLRTQTTDPRERGTALGTWFGDQVSRIAELYLEHFATLGIPEGQVRAIATRSHEALRAWAQALADESDACADASGVERWQVAAVGARTEILAAGPAPGKGECSTAVFAPPGTPPQTMQTWDWHDSLVPDALLHELTPRTGRTVKLFTEFGVPGKIGVNSAGLGVHFNILFHATDATDATYATGTSNTTDARHAADATARTTGTDAVPHHPLPAAGVPVHAIARRILDEADTLDQAVEIASTARVSASTSLTVVTADSRAASLELSPAGLAVVPAGEDGWLLHTNHFLDAGLAAAEAGTSDSLTAERLAHLKAVRALMPGLDPGERAKALCGAAGADAVVCMRPDEAKPAHQQWGTLLTIGLDVNGCALDYLAGAPYEATTRPFARF